MHDNLLTYKCQHACTRQARVCTWLIMMQPIINMHTVYSYLEICMHAICNCLEACIYACELMRMHACIIYIYYIIYYSTKYMHAAHVQSLNEFEVRTTRHSCTVYTRVLDSTAGRHMYIYACTSSQTSCKTCRRELVTHVQLNACVGIARVDHSV